MTIAQAIQFVESFGSTAHVDLDKLVITDCEGCVTRIRIGRKDRLVEMNSLLAHVGYDD